MSSMNSLTVHLSKAITRLTRMAAVRSKPYYG